MSITIREFQVAMETYGAERSSDYCVSGNNVLVPCFNVAGTYFIHSSSNYIVQRGKRVPEEILICAMAELGEKHPGGKNFWWGQIQSLENDNIKVTKKGKIKTTKIGYFFDCKKIV